MNTTGTTSGLRQPRQFTLTEAGEQALAGADPTGWSLTPAGYAALGLCMYTGPRHDTITAYSDGCRHPAARAAHTRWQKRYNLDCIQGKTRTVPVEGTRRRLHALMAIGHPLADIAAAGHVPYESINKLGQVTRVRLATADGVRRAYDLLSMTLGPSPVVANRARARGYQPPLAWDDHTIDDPKARPAGHRRRTGQPASARVAS